MPTPRSSAPTRRPGVDVRAMVRAPAWDVGLPVVGYYVLGALGASDGGGPADRERPRRRPGGWW